jgi:hypothetical protein
MMMLAGADWLPKFWWDIFSRGPQKKKIADLKKKKVNSKGLLPPPKQEISTDQADLKKGHDAEGPPIALGAPKPEGPPNLRGPVGFFPPSYMASPPLDAGIIFFLNI